MTPVRIIANRNRALGPMLQWGLDNDFDYEWNIVGRGPEEEWIAEFRFHNPDHALLFKLTWGGQ